MIDAERWKALTFPKQMGNIASELSRASHFQGQGDSRLTESSLWRAIELIELTIDAQGSSVKTRELCRFREVVCDWYCRTGIYPIQPEALTKYALSFL